MRWLVLAAACGCAGNAPGSTSSSTPDADVIIEALPTPRCGEGFCSQCVGCSQRDSLCFGDYYRFDFSIGQCTAEPVEGSFSLGAFTATDSAGVVADAYVEIVARAGDETRAVMAPATPGDQACSIFHSYSAGVLSSPACSITVTAIGAVGGRIEGTLTVGADTGTFSVTRVAYP